MGYLTAFLCIYLLSRQTAVTAQDEAAAYRLKLLPSKLDGKMAGESIAVQCQMDPPVSDPKLKWVKVNRNGADTPISRTGRLSASSSGKSGGLNLLILNATKPDDEGDYRCEGFDATDKKIDSTIALKLHIPIEFVDADLIQNPTAGTEARIRCVVTADPPADVTWHKSFQPITDDGPRAYNFEQDSQVLVIPNFSADDNGDYECNAIQSETGKIKSRTIHVEAFVKPEITHSFGNVTVNEGGTTSLVCGATGNPAPIFLWFKQIKGESAETGTHLLDDEDDAIGQPKPSRKKEGVLDIEGATESDAGAYVCKANNSVSSDSKVGYLRVFLKPKISKSDEVKHVNKEESVDIDCKFTGEEVDVFWQHNSETYKVLDGEDETPQEGRISVRKEGTNDEQHLILSIKNVQMEDVGSYKCSVNNPAGLDEWEVKLEVTRAPTIVDFTPGPIKSVIAKSEELSCKAEAAPKPTWTWKHPNGNTLSSDDVTFSIVNSDKQPYETKLKIFALKENDFGTYICTADNGISPGPAQQEMVILQLVIPPKPEKLEQVGEEPTKINLRISNYEANLEERQRPSGVLVKVDKKEPKEEAPEVIEDPQEGETKTSASDDGSPDWSVIDAREYSIGDDMLVVITNLEPSKEYYLSAAGSNLAGKSDFVAADRVFHTSAPRVPLKPDVKSEVIECVGAHCEVKWGRPDDQGSSIRKFHIRHHKIEAFEGNYPPSQSEIREITGWTAPLELENNQLAKHIENLEPNSFYEIEIRAENDQGPSEPALVYLKTGQGAMPPGGVSTGAVVAIVIILILIILIVIDISCYYMNRCGLLMCICVSCCGKATPSKDKVVVMEEGKPKSDDKQPLKDMHNGEKEPDDKPEPGESTPMILDEQLKSEKKEIKNSSV